MKLTLDHWIDQHIDRLLRLDQQSSHGEKRRADELFFSSPALAIALGIGTDRVLRRAIERLEVANAALARASNDAQTASRAKSDFVAMTRSGRAHNELQVASPKLVPA